MQQPRDFCDLIKALRAYYFAKDRDITLVVNRKIILGGGEVLDDIVKAPFVTTAASGDLANERVLTAGTAIGVTDGGPGGNATLDHTQVAAGDLHTEYTREAVLTAKGSIYGASAASTPAELGVGVDGAALVADSTQATGLAWSVGAAVPVGMIAMWSGAVVDIPASWSLCDGSNGTPDLTGMFIVGAGGALDPGDTGGSNSVDISHTHDPGTLSTNSDNHTHASGTLATNSDAHTHASGTLSTNSDAHTHSDGTLATALDGAHVHSLDVGTWVASGSGFDAITALGAESDHTHDVTGATGSDSHSHSVNAGATGSDSHSHSVNAGATGSDSHSHSVNAGATASGGGVAVENRPAFYALCFIMRTA
jgi:hypothetical protein